MQKPGKPPTVPIIATRDCAKSTVSAATQQIDATCQLIAAGRIAASQLAVLAKSSGLSEAEFRLLWLLHAVCSQHPTDLSSPLLDQKTMGEKLGLSAAQVSAVVERLRQATLIEGQPSHADRRRNVWQLTTLGTTLLENSVTTFAATTTLPAPILQEDAA